MDMANDYIVQCLDYYGYDRNLPVEMRFKDFNFNKAAVCATDWRLKNLYLPELEELRNFLDDNPHYRYPGSGLPNGVVGNLSPCWGKTKQYHKEGGC